MAHFSTVDFRSFFVRLATFAVGLGLAVSVGCQRGGPAKPTGAEPSEAGGRRQGAGAARGRGEAHHGPPSAGAHGRRLPQGVELCRPGHGTHAGRGRRAEDPGHNRKVLAHSGAPEQGPRRGIRRDVGLRRQAAFRGRQGPPRPGAVDRCAAAADAPVGLSGLAVDRGLDAGICRGHAPGHPHAGGRSDGRLVARRRRTRAGGAGHDRRSRLLPGEDQPGPAGHDHFLDRSRDVSAAAGRYAHRRAGAGH